MTIIQFLDLFQKYPSQWVIDNGGIYSKEDFCPITWVCFKEYNKYYSPLNAIQAGYHLGLSRTDILKIIDSTDNNEFLSNFDPKLRKQILKIIR